MPVMISEVDHTVPPPTGTETRSGVGDRGNASQSSASAAIAETQTIAAIRRETARQARLWAD